MRNGRLARTSGKYRSAAAQKRGEPWLRIKEPFQKNSLRPIKGPCDNLELGAPIRDKCIACQMELADDGECPRGCEDWNLPQSPVTPLESWENGLYAEEDHEWDVYRDEWDDYSNWNRSFGSYVHQSASWHIDQMLAKAWEDVMWPEDEEEAELLEWSEWYDRKEMEAFLTALKEADLFPQGSWIAELI